MDIKDLNFNFANNFEITLWDYVPLILKRSDQH